MFPSGRWQIVSSIGARKSSLHVPQCFASSCVCSVEKEYSLGMSDWTGSDSEGSDKENHDQRCRDID